MNTHQHNIPLAYDLIRQAVEETTPKSFHSFHDATVMFYRDDSIEVHLRYKLFSSQRHTIADSRQWFHYIKLIRMPKSHDLIPLSSQPNDEVPEYIYRQNIYGVITLI